jgi:ATP-dependent helicase HrpA
VISDIDQQFHVKVQETDFRQDTLPAHLFMNFRIIDQHGRMLRAGRNLSQLKAQFGDQAQATFQEMAAQGEPVIADQALDQITQWSFETLPEVMEIRRAGKSVLGYPALVDEGTHCRIDVFDDAQTAQHCHRLGLLRLLRIGLKDQIKFLEKNIPEALRLGVLYMPLGAWEQLRRQIIDAALSRAVLEQQPWPTDAESFAHSRELAKERVGLLAQELSRLVLTILEHWEVVKKRLVQFKVHESACKDIASQLSELLPPDFVMKTPYEQLKHLPRYLEAIAVRFDGLRADATRDQSRMTEMAPLLGQYRRARQALAGAPEPGLDQYFWMLQELRVALFAQRLRTPYPVSVKRLYKAWEALQR